MKYILNFLLLTCLATTALAQQKPPYDRTTTNQVLADRATWSRYFMAIPKGPTPGFPAYVPDSLKCGALWYRTTDTALYQYNCITNVWGKLASLANSNLYADGIKAGLAVRVDSLNAALHSAEQSLAALKVLGPLNTYGNITFHGAGGRVVQTGGDGVTALDSTSAKYITLQSGDASLRIFNGSQTTIIKADAATSTREHQIPDAAGDFVVASQLPGGGVGGHDVTKADSAKLYGTVLPTYRLKTDTTTDGYGIKRIGKNRLIDTAVVKSKTGFLADYNNLKAGIAGNSTSKADSAALYGVANGIKANLATIAANLITANTATFADGSGVSYLKAAPAYGGISFIADTWYAMHASPSSFSSSYIIALANKYIAAKDVNGNFPIYLNGTTGVAGFISGCDVALFRPTGDGTFFIPSLYLLYYQKSGDITQFNTHGSELKTALDQIPLDGNGLVTISTTAAQNWIPWGFQDGVRSTGANLMGTLLYYKACVDMATMYTANGQTSLATTMTARASTIASNITASLWDGTDGMFYNAGTNNRQIDVLGSTYAAYLGVATSSQITAISNYLVTNYATLTKAGYIRQSPTNWAFSWQGNQCNRGTGNYDDGFWSVGNEWVSFAMSQTSTNAANRYVNDFITTYDPTQEYYGNSTLAPVSGVTNNSESPAGTLAYVNSLYPTTGTLARFVKGATPNLNDPIVSLGNGTIGPGKRQWTSGGDGTTTGTILSTPGKLSVGINSGSLAARIMACFPTGNQIVAAYDSLHSTTMNTDAAGNFTITPSNGNVTNAGSLTVTGPILGGTSGRNFWSPGSSSATATSTSQLLYGNATTNFFRIGFYGSAATSLTTGAEYGGYTFGASPITTFTSGTHPYVAQVVFRPVLITNAGATVTNAAAFIAYGRASGATNNYVGLVYNDGGAGTNNTWFKYGITRVSGLQADSLAKFTHIAGGTSSPTIAAGAGAGTSPTVSISGTDLSGTITVTTGTSPTANTTIATVTFNSAYTTAPRVAGNPAAKNTTTASLSATSPPFYTTTTTTLVLMGNTSALAPSTTYVWDYTLTQ